MTTASGFYSVYDDKTCIGFLVQRGKSSFEAFDTPERSLGVFPSQREAASVIMRKEL